MPGDYLGPPEIVTSRLQAGPGVAPMLAVEAAWLAKAAQYAEQLAQMSAVIAQATGAWQSASSAAMATSAAKGMAWLATAAGLAAKAALQASAQAAAYTAAYTALVQLAEVAANHITHAVLEATDFMGINAAPIAANETDYCVRMPGQNAAAMGAYEAAAGANVAALPTFDPPAPMTIPDVGLDGLASSGFFAAAGAPGVIARDAVFSAATGSSMTEAGFGQGGRLGGAVGQAQDIASALGAATGIAGTDTAATTTEAGADDAGEQLAGVGSVLQTVSSLPGQLGGSGLGGSGLGQGFSPTALMSPLQQIMSLGSGGYGVDSTGTPVDQVGLLGASPFSDHPVAGGGGAAIGAGMVSGGIPGTGGVAVRSSQLASLTAPGPTAASSPPAAGSDGAVTAGPNAARAGGAPVGAMPIGAGRGREGDGDIAGLASPVPLRFDEQIDDLDDWNVWGGQQQR